MPKKPRKKKRLGVVYARCDPVPKVFWVCPVCGIGNRDRDFDIGDVEIECCNCESEFILRKRK